MLPPASHCSWYNWQTRVKQCSLINLFWAELVRLESEVCISLCLEQGGEVWPVLTSADQWWSETRILWECGRDNQWSVNIRFYPGLHHWSALTDRVIVERMDELHSWVGTVSGCGGARVQYWSLPHMYSTKYNLFENDADDEILKYSHYLSSVHFSLVHHQQAPLIKQCWKVKIAALVVTLSKK